MFEHLSHGGVVKTERGQHDQRPDTVLSVDHGASRLLVEQTLPSAAGNHGRGHVPVSDRHPVPPPSASRRLSSSVGAGNSPSEVLGIRMGAMIETRMIPGDSSDALMLVGAMFDDVVAAYGTDLGSGPSATPADFSPPGGRFVALYENGRAVAGGGVKRLDDETAEIKRMYVVPEARGRELSRRLLAALEDAALELGYRRIRLDTGAHEAQRAARHLYPSAGYSEIPDYNHNPYASYWAEKRL